MQVTIVLQCLQLILKCQRLQVLILMQELPITLYALKANTTPSQHKRPAFLAEPVSIALLKVSLMISLIAHQATIALKEANFQQNVV